MEVCSPKTHHRMSGMSGNVVNSRVHQLSLNPRPQSARKADASGKRAKSLPLSHDQQIKTDSQFTTVNKKSVSKVTENTFKDIVRGRKASDKKAVRVARTVDVSQKGIAGRGRNRGVPIVDQKTNRNDYLPPNRFAVTVWRTPEVFWRTVRRDVRFMSYKLYTVHAPLPLVRGRMKLTWQEGKRTRLSLTNYHPRYYGYVRVVRRILKTLRDYWMFDPVANPDPYQAFLEEREAHLAMVSCSVGLDWKWSQHHIDEMRQTLTGQGGSESSDSPPETTTHVGLVTRSFFPKRAERIRQRNLAVLRNKSQSSLASDESNFESAERESASAQSEEDGNNGQFIRDSMGAFLSIIKLAADEAGSVLSAQFNLLLNVIGNLYAIYYLPAAGKILHAACLANNLRTNFHIAYEEYKQLSNLVSCFFTPAKNDLYYESTTELMHGQSGFEDLATSNVTQMEIEFLKLAIVTMTAQVTDWKECWKIESLLRYYSEVRGLYDMPFGLNMGPGTRVIKAVLSFLKFLAERISDFAETKDWKSFLKGSDDFLTWINESREHLTHVATPDLSAKDIQDRILEVLKLIERGKKFERKYSRPDNKDKRDFYHQIGSYMTRLEDRAAEYRTQLMASSAMVAPFSIFLFGTVGTGKSFIIPALTRILCGYLDLDQSDSNVFVVQPNMKFDDGLVTQQVFVFDDMGMLKVDTGEALFQMMGTVGAVRQLSHKADVTDKGKVVRDPRVVIATSNVLDLNATNVVNTPAAAMRRFPWVLVPIPKKEYRVAQGLQIDSSKVPLELTEQLLPDTHHFYLWRVEAGVGTTTNTMRYHSVDWVSDKYVETGCIDYERVQHIAQSQEVFDGRLTTQELLYVLDHIMRKFKLSHHSYTKRIEVAKKVGYCVHCLQFTPEVHVCKPILVARELDTSGGAKRSIPVELVTPVEKGVLRPELVGQSGLESYLSPEVRVLITVVMFVAIYRWQTLHRWGTFTARKFTARVYVENRTLFLTSLISAITGYLLGRYSSPSQSNVNVSVSNPVPTPSGADPADVPVVHTQGGVQSFPAGTLVRAIQDGGDPWRAGYTIAEEARPAERVMTTSDAAVLQLFRDATVVITWGDNGVTRRVGRAVWITSGMLLVNRHVYEDYVNDDQTVTNVSFPWKMKITRGSHHSVGMEFTVTRDIIADLQGTDMRVISIPKISSRDLTEYCYEPLGTNYGYVIREKEDMLIHITATNCGPRIYPEGQIEYVYSAQLNDGESGCPVLRYIGKKLAFVGLHSGYYGKGDNRISGASRWHKALVTVCAQKLLVKPQVGTGPLVFDVPAPVADWDFRSELNRAETMAGLTFPHLTKIGVITDFRKKTFSTSAIETVYSSDLDYANPKVPPIMSRGAKVIVDGREEWCSNERNLSLQLAALRDDINLRTVHDECEEWASEFHVATPYRFLTQFESINGVPGDRWIDRLDMATGAGYPFDVCKKELFQDPHGHATPGFKLADALWRLNKTLEGDGDLHALFTLMLKDEFISPEKARRFKVRFYSVASVSFNIVFRQYFLPWFVFFRRERALSYSAVGIDAYGPEWDAIANTLSGCHHVIAGDYAGFDKTLPYSLVLSFMFLVEKIIKRFNMVGWVDKLSVMWKLAEAIARPTYVWMKNAFTVYGTLPSGLSGTTDIGNVANVVILRLAWKSLRPELRFRDWNKLYVYGDDHVLGTNDREFDFLHVKKFVGSISMRYTTTRKDNSVDSQLSVGEVTFLKRSFVWRNGLWYAPLELESIKKMTKGMIASNDLSPMVQSMMILYNAYTELCIHENVGEVSHIRSQLEKIQVKYYPNECPIRECEDVLESRFREYRLTAVALSDE